LKSPARAASSAGIIPSTNPTSTGYFQNSDRDQIAKRDRAYRRTRRQPLHQRDGQSHARSRRERGLPADAIACMTTATIEGTEALMKHKMTAVILATWRNRFGAGRLLRPANQPSA
jgi:hypothetical protein